MYEHFKTYNFLFISIVAMKPFWMQNSNIEKTEPASVNRRRTDFVQGAVHVGDGVSQSFKCVSRFLTSLLSRAFYLDESLTRTSSEQTSYRRLTVLLVILFSGTGIIIKSRR